MGYKIIANSRKYGNQEILLDEQDYNKLKSMTVCVNLTGRKTKRFYAVVVLPGRKSVKLHRYILGLVDTKQVVDHINGNPLDNRRGNLRVTNSRGNRLNTRKTASVTQSKYIGVRWDNQRSLWRVDLKSNGKYWFGGRYRLEESAAFAYNVLALIHHGPTATLNGVKDEL